MEFTRAALLGQIRLTDPTPTTLLTAEIKTEIALLMAAPDDPCDLTLHHSVSGAVVGPGNRVLYRYSVNPAFQGPILAIQSPGGGMTLEAGDVLTAVLEAGAGLTLSVYGITATLSPTR